MDKEKRRHAFSRLWGRLCAVPHLFGKLVVFWCIAVATAASAWALRILSYTGHDPAALLGVILAFFGGELMILCLKTILAGKKQKNVSKSDTEGEGYEGIYEEDHQP